MTIERPYGSIKHDKAAVLHTLANSGANDIRQLNQLAPSLIVSSTGSEANGSIARYDALSAGDRADLMAFLRSLKTWPTFGKGWTRRVDDVRRVALAMAGSAATPAPAPTPTANPLGPLARLFAALLAMFAGKR